MSFTSRLSAARQGAILTPQLPPTQFPPSTQQEINSNPNNIIHPSNDTNIHNLPNESEIDANNDNDTTIQLYAHFSDPLSTLVEQVQTELRTTTQQILPQLHLQPSLSYSSSLTSTPSQSQPLTPSKTKQQSSLTSLSSPNQTNNKNNNKNQKGGLKAVSTKARDLNVDSLSENDITNDYLLNLYSNPWYRLNQSVTTSTPLQLAPTSPLLSISSQTAASINPYKEIKHRFGSTILLPPPNQHKQRFERELRQAHHINTEERNRLMRLYAREGHDSILAPGIQLPHMCGFQLHFCETYTLGANNLSNKLQLTPNSTLYYCFIATTGFYNDLTTFEQMQSTHDYNDVIEYCLRKPTIPQCLFHLSYIFEYHNQISEAFDWIRVALSLFERSFGIDVLYGIFSGKVKFLSTIPTTEYDNITQHTANNQSSKDLTILKHCNTQLIHAMNKVFARYSHFLTKKASSGSSFGLTSLCAQLCNHVMVATNNNIASYLNTNPLTAETTLTSNIPILYDPTNTTLSTTTLPTDMTNIDPTTQLQYQIATIYYNKLPQKTNIYQLVRVTNLYQHLSLPPSSLTTNINQQFDPACLSYFFDYYGLKGNRYLDVLLYGLYNMPHYYGGHSFDITQSIFAPYSLDNNNNNNNTISNTQNNNKNDKSILSSPISTPTNTTYNYNPLQSTTSLAEYHYGLSCGILAPLLTTYHDRQSHLVNPQDLTIKLTPHVTKSFFPLLILPARWTLNWSYSMAYAMIKLERQFSKHIQQQYESLQQQYYSFTTLPTTNNSQLTQQQEQMNYLRTTLDWLKLSNQINYVSEMDLMNLLSLDTIIMHKSKPILVTPYLGLVCDHKTQVQFNQNEHNLKMLVKQGDSMTRIDTNDLEQNNNNGENNNNNTNDNTNTNTNVLSKFPSNPLLHILQSHHVTDSSIAYSIVTNNNNINTPPTGGGKTKNMNGLSSIISNTQYKTMYSNLFPTQFISLAYLTRAIILFPETIQLLCDIPLTNKKDDSNSNDDNNTKTTNDDDEQENNQYTARTDLSQNTKFKYILDCIGYDTLKKQSKISNPYYDKASLVYSKRSSSLWKQTSIQDWIEAGITCAYNILTKYQSLCTTSLTTILPQIRNVLYNQSYYSTYQYSLKTLEQSDYCDDVVRFDTNDIITQPQQQAGFGTAVGNAMNNVMGNAMNMTGNLATLFQRGGTNMMNAFNQFLQQGQENLTNTLNLNQDGLFEQFRTFLSNGGNVNNDANNNNEDDEEYDNDDNDSWADDDDDEDGYDDNDDDIDELEDQLRALGLPEEEIQSILADEQSQQQSSNNNRQSRSNNNNSSRSAQTANVHVPFGDNLIEDVDEAHVDDSSTNTSNQNEQLDEDFIE